MYRLLLFGGFSAALLIGVLGVYWLGTPFHLTSARDFAVQNGFRPTVVLERTNWDFGVVSPGSILRVTFPLKNAGRRDLLVRKCAMNTELSAGTPLTAILQPGESVDLVITVNTKGLQGKIQIESPYTTSDPCLPEFTVTILADVQH